MQYRLFKYNVLYLSIVGTELNMRLTFLSVPWNMDRILIGWGFFEQFKLTERLLDWISMQRDMSIMVGNTLQDDNTCLTDIDEQPVSVEQYLWVDEPEPASEQSESILTCEQKQIIDELLIEFNVVFEEKLLGSAKVEPMKIEMKPD